MLKIINYIKNLFKNLLSKFSQNPPCFQLINKKMLKDQIFYIIGQIFMMIYIHFLILTKYLKHLITQNIVTLIRYLFQLIILIF